MDVGLDIGEFGFDRFPGARDVGTLTSDILELVKRVFDFVDFTANYVGTKFIVSIGLLLPFSGGLRSVSGLF